MLFGLGMVAGAGMVVVGSYFAALYLVARFSVKPIRIVQWYSPAMSGLPQEDFEAVTDDGVTIDGWLVPADGPTVLVFVHGYMMNRCEYAPYSVRFHNLGYPCVFFDTRAHGRSGGDKVGIGYSEQRDVAAVLAMVTNRFPGKRVVLVGSSMGSVACLYAAAAHPDLVEGLVLDAPYATLQEAVTGWWSFVGVSVISSLLRPVAPMGALIAGIPLKAVRPIDVAHHVGNRPLLLMTGDRDPIAPPARIREMASLAGPRASAHVFEGCTHGQIRAKYAAQFGEMLEQFLRVL